uniref:Uncharacterized protein n=1 Tax=Chrysotila carterae TaxID=13221 RepID=A0A7S4C4R3_CHRCT
MPGGGVTCTVLECAPHQDLEGIETATVSAGPNPGGQTAVKNAGSDRAEASPMITPNPRAEHNQTIAAANKALDEQATLLISWRAMQSSHTGSSQEGGPGAATARSFSSSVNPAFTNAMIASSSRGPKYSAIRPSSINKSVG